MIKTSIIIFKIGESDYGSLFLPFEEKRAVSTLKHFFDIDNYVLIEGLRDFDDYLTDREFLINLFKHYLNE